MCNPVVRAALALSISLALASGSALARISKESKKAATKTVTASKSVSSSKEAAARQARLKKIGSATPKTESKAKQHKTAAKPAAKSTKKYVPAAHDQIARSTDGGSVAERRARIHSMQVPE
jgi:hypothetical protein